MTFSSSSPPSTKTYERWNMEGWEPGRTIYCTGEFATFPTDTVHFSVHLFHFLKYPFGCLAFTRKREVPHNFSAFWHELILDVDLCLIHFRLDASPYGWNAQHKVYSMLKGLRQA